MYSSRREQHKRPDKQKWEEDVDDFLTKMNSSSKKPDQSEHEEIDHKEEDEQEPSCDNISLTSLMKFVAQKLESKKSLYLKGPFQYR